MMRRLREPNPVSPEKGQALVEFAFTALIFFIVIFGIIDLGRAVFEYNVLSSSAREGARMAVIHYYSDAQVKARVVDSSGGFINLGDVTITGSRTCNSDPCPSVSVTVTHTFTPVTPLIGTIVGNSISMKASSTMVVER